MILRMEGTSCGTPGRVRHRPSASASGQPRAGAADMTPPMADTLGIAHFETALGDVGLAWSELGLAALFLPEARVEDGRVPREGNVLKNAPHSSCWMAAIWFTIGGQ